MEFLFGLIGILFAIGMIISIPYLIYGKWSLAKAQIIDLFRDGDGFIGVLMVLIGIMVAMLIFVLLCAMNNSVWHLDYWTTEGLWKK